MARWTNVAAWRGPAANNFGDGDYVEREPADALTEVRGLVVHIADGTFAGTISWERNPASNVSSHFVAAKDGRLAQMVDTHDRAWTQRTGNSRWLSVECEGYGGQTLTSAQLDALARLLAEAHRRHGVPLQVTSSSSGRGLGHHSMDPDWGHQSCPGAPIIAQKAEIVARAQRIINGSVEEGDMGVHQGVVPGGVREFGVPIALTGGIRLGSRAWVSFGTDGAPDQLRVAVHTGEEDTWWGQLYEGGNALTLDPAKSMDKCQILVPNGTSKVFVTRLGEDISHPVVYMVKYD